MDNSTNNLCSQNSEKKGSKQKVISYSFYGEITNKERKGLEWKRKLKTINLLRAICGY